MTGTNDTNVKTDEQNASIANFVTRYKFKLTDEAWAPGAKVYRDEQGQPEIQLIYDGGHALPSDADELIVKFFKQNRAK